MKTTTTTKSQSPRNPKGENEMDNIYRQFYLAVVEFGNDPGNLEKQKHLQEIQRQVEEKEDLYREGRKLIFEKKLGQKHGN